MKILDAVVAVVAERGVAGASVGLVTARAGVSRRTFYERFDGLDRCLLAVLDGALEKAAPLVVEAFSRDGPWQEGMRCALAAMLDFFDSEPALARVCMLELGAAAPAVREHRERILSAFAGIVLARIEGEVSHPSPLAAEGIYASVVGIVNARLSERERRPLVELLGPLMGVILAPFMDDAQVAAEIERGNALARKIQAERAQPRAVRSGGRERERAGVEIPALLSNARAERARQCLRYLAEQDAQGIARCNREIATAIGIAHKGQVSKLLARLESHAILSKTSHGAGRPNAWRLTPYGREIAAYFEPRETG